MDVFNELMRREPGLLQKPIEELVPISFVGGAAVQAYRALVSRLSNLPMTEEQKRKTLADGQDAGKMLLAIEARIGELLPETDRAGRSTTPDSSGKRHHAEMPDEISKRQRDSARAIARHPEAVARVIAEAEENEDIPTKTAVLNRIRLQQEQERRGRAEGREKPDLIVSLEEQSYLMKLEKTMHDCPPVTEIPRNWHEEPFQRACAMARIIYKRLEVLIHETKNLTG